MQKKPTTDITIGNKRVVEFRYTPFRCGDFSCHYSPDSVGIYMLNPITERPKCPTCGKEMICDNSMKELFERHEYINGVYRS